jgi:hypothetical protein
MEQFVSRKTNLSYKKEGALLSKTPSKILNNIDDPKVDLYKLLSYN